MKRHKALETLSFEHHDALVVALRIKKGLNKNVEPQIISKYVQSVFEHHLQHHFNQEEQAFKEPLQQRAEMHELLQKMLQEHQHIQQLVSKLKEEKSGLDAILQEIASILEQHIRFEERDLFKAIEEQLTPQELERIDRFLHQQHRPIDKGWQIEFWKD